MIETVYYSAKVEDTEPDRRYRCLIILGRSDRPSHWNFHCPKCTYKVGELMNTEVMAMTDMIDMDNTDTLGFGVRCDGRYQGGRCRQWFYFSLGFIGAA